MASKKKKVQLNQEPILEDNETHEDHSEVKKFQPKKVEHEVNEDIKEADEANIFNDFYAKSTSSINIKQSNSSLPGNVFSINKNKGSVKKLSREDDIKQKMKDRRLGASNTLTKSILSLKGINSKSTLKHQDSEKSSLTKSVNFSRKYDDGEEHRTASGKKGVDFKSLTLINNDEMFRKKKRVTIMPSLKPQSTKIKNSVFDQSDEDVIHESILENKPVRETDEDSIDVKEKIDKKYKMYDFIFPGENIARQCKFTIPEEITEDDITNVISDFSDLEKPQPVIILSGARTSERTNLLVAISRVARSCDAVIVDSGVATGIENPCQSQQVKLAGVFLENQITMPKISATDIPETDLTYGHTHLFMIPKNEESDTYMNWGSEASLKFLIANGIAKGNKHCQQKKFNKCKIVVVCMGDHISCLQDLHFANKHDLPCIIVQGSSVTDKINAYIKESAPLHNEKIEEIIRTGHCYALTNNKSEDLSAMIHFFQTVTPW